MTDYARFNPKHPLEQLADQARRDVAELALRHLDGRADAFQFFVMGLLTGVAGVAISHFEPDELAHLHLRAWIAACVPQAFDQARGIVGLPPLPEARR